MPDIGQFLRQTASTLAPYVPGLLQLGGTVYGGIQTNNAINNATNALVQGGQQAIGTIGTGTAQAQQALQDTLNPFVQAGQTQLPSMAQAVQPGGTFNTPFNADTFNLYQDPSFQFRLAQALAATKAGEFASGLGYSPATLKALNDYAQGQASTEFGNAFQRYQTD